MSDERAIIDIGSNTVRLVIYGGPARAPTVLYNEKVTARLGKGVAETGMLTEKAMDSVITALGRFAKLLELRGVSDVQTVATAATRDAANGALFLEAIHRCGLSPRLLSGEEEALTSAAGIMGAFPGSKGVVADLGGGSLELVHIDGPHAARGASLPFGTLWLPQLRADGPDKFARRIKKALIASEWHCLEGEALYLVGGSHRSLARLAISQLNWPIDDPHGFELALEAIQHVCRSALRGGVGSAVPGVPISRLAALPNTAALLSVLLREVKPSSVVFSSWGLREGLLYQRLSETERGRDPLLVGVGAFVASMGCPPENAAGIAEWTSCAQRDSSQARERVRLAATMLLTAAQSIEPNLRLAHALDWALHKRWIGLDDTGRAMIAACSVGNSGNAGWPEDLDRLASQEDLHAAHTWGLAIRLCRRFSGLSRKALELSKLAVTDGKLSLTVDGSLASLRSEGTTKDLRNLAESLGLEPSLQVS